ncbi:MAG: glycosyltransferase [Desulfuromonas sp.]
MLMKIATENDLLAGLTTGFPEIKKALVFAPHPDDEIFGCGGTICLLQAAGVKVEVHILTNGACGGDNSAGDLSAVRLKESCSALGLLGIAEPDCWQLPDRGLRYGEILISRVLSVIERASAELIFFPSPVELHPDHQVMAFVGLEIIRRSANGVRVAFFEIGAALQQPNCLIDISSVAQSKQQAMTCFASQLTEQPYVDRINGLNLFRSFSLGADVSHAEAFFLVDKAHLEEARTLLLAGTSIYRNKLGFAASNDDIPLVSIIVRSMDRSTLGEALDSIAIQTYENIEVVVVNAKGGQHSPLGEHCGRFPLRLVNQNQDPLLRSKAANVGLSSCRGKFLAFLDEDDTYEPDHVQVLVETAQQNAKDVVVYAGVKAGWRNNAPVGKEILFAEPDMCFARLIQGNNIPIHAPLFPASLRDKGVAFDEQLDGYEDWDFWLQLASLVPFIYVDNISATYYMGGSSGLSPLAPDMEIVPQRVRQVFSKWLQRLTPKQMQEVGELFLHRQAERQAIEEEIGNLRARLEKISCELTAATADNDRLRSQASDDKGRIGLLQRQLADQAGQIGHLNDVLSAMQCSRSWRLTLPLRVAGAGSRRIKIYIGNMWRFLRRDGLLVLLKKTLRVAQQEGLKGIRYRLSQRVSTAVPGTINELGRPSAALQWDAVIGYVLSDRFHGYTYIVPRRPSDFSQKMDAMEPPPVFSIVVPIYNTPVALLEKLITSVKYQWYPHWQLIFLDDASSAKETIDFLAELNEQNIEVYRLEQNSGIAAATNMAVNKATGDYVVLLDHDDELTVDCLYELAFCIDRDRPDYIYSDEDKIAEDGTFIEPHFKPDWSPDTMMSTMYTCHVSCIRRELWQALGGLRSDYDGCQDWDLVLRLSEKTAKIVHIPKVLYHWRIIAGSTAEDLSAKPYVLDASRRVRLDALKRRGLNGEVEAVAEVPGYFRVKYALRGDPLISIIIPTRDNGAVLHACLESLRTRSSYRHYEVIILDNGSVESKTLCLLNELAAAENITVIRHDAPFNFSQLNNLGAKAASGELLLFLNDDTEVLSADWLERLGGYACLPHVGAVGAKLLYPNGRGVQHVGVLNLESGPRHALQQLPARSPGYYMRNLLEYNWLAVTGACMLIDAKKFHQVGGFNEEFPVAYNDIDLCFRLHEAGFYNLVCPSVELIHHESISRGSDQLDFEKKQRLEQDKRRLYQHHPKYYQHDPFYNPNLHPNGINFELI